MANACPIRMGERQISTIRKLKSAWLGTITPTPRKTQNPPMNLLPNDSAKLPHARTNPDSVDDRTFRQTRPGVKLPSQIRRRKPTTAEQLHTLVKVRERKVTS